MRIIAVIPVLNEEQNIVRVLTEILFDCSLIEIIYVVDGGSSDNTVMLAKSVTRKTQVPIIIVNNQEKIQACAINKIAKLYKNDAANCLLIRIDAHSYYPKGFVNQLVKTCIEKKVDSVVVPLVTIGGNNFQDSAAALFNSWLGTGGAAHRSGGESGLVDHGHHAAIRLHTFLKIGGYNSKFLANEDAEFDKRLIDHGGSIYLDTKAAIKYIPRSGFRALFKQYYTYGYYRCSTILLHKMKIKLRQLLPPCAAVFLLLLLFSIFIFLDKNDPKWLVLGIPTLFYLLFVLLTAYGISRKIISSSWVDVASIAIVSHLAFGFGFLRRILNSFTGRSI